MRRVTGSPWIVDFRCWTWPEVAILRADQKERGLWGRECSRHRCPHVTLIVTLARLLVLHSFPRIFEEKRDCSQFTLWQFLNIHRLMSRCQMRYDLAKNSIPYLWSFQLVQLPWPYKTAQKDTGTQVNNRAHFFSMNVNEYVIADTMFGSPVSWVMLVNTLSVHWYDNFWPKIKLHHYTYTQGVYYDLLVRPIRSWAGQKLAHLLFMWLPHP